MNHQPEIIVTGNSIELQGNGDGTYEIHLSDPNQNQESCIGIIEGTHNTLSDIYIEEKHRGRGFGREAIELYIQQAKKANCDSIKTTAVLHPAVSYILQDNEFEPFETLLDEDKVIRNRYKKEFKNNE